MPTQTVGYWVLSVAANLGWTVTQNGNLANAVSLGARTIRSSAALCIGLGNRCGDRHWLHGPSGLLASHDSEFISAVIPTAPAMALDPLERDIAFLIKLDQWLQISRFATGFFCELIQPRLIQPFHQLSRKQLTT